MDLVQRHDGDTLSIGGVLYAPQSELGRGGYGRVDLYTVAPGTVPPPGAPGSIAVKWVQVQPTDRDRDGSLSARSKVRREIENAMELPDHPNVCKTYGWEQDEADPSLVRIYMEHVEGYDMLRWAQMRREGYDEPTLWHIFQQILHGVLHCHEQDICHRDLKADNVVVMPDSTAKLIDFGLSKNVAASEAHSLVGTPAYLPPEIAQADGRTPYDPFKGDAWSLGVALYVIACREYPFGCDGEGGEPRDTVLERITTASWANPGTMAFGGRLLSAKLEQRTRPLQGLICRLLTIDPVDRISLTEVKEHAWFYERGVTAERLSGGDATLAAAAAAATGGGGGGGDMGTGGLSAQQQAALGMEGAPSRWDQVIHDLPFDDSTRDAIEMAMMAVGVSEEMAMPVGISWQAAAEGGGGGPGPQPEPEALAAQAAGGGGGGGGGDGGGGGGGEMLVANMSYEMPVLPSMNSDGSWLDDLPPAQSWLTQQAFAAAKTFLQPLHHE